MEGDQKFSEMVELLGPQNLAIVELLHSHKILNVVCLQSNWLDSFWMDFFGAFGTDKYFLYLHWVWLYGPTLSSKLVKRSTIGQSVGFFGQIFPQADLRTTAGRLELF